jgi:SAM-dependent methyltransferase
VWCNLITGALGVADHKEHWQRVYADKRENEVSWYEASPATSLSLIENADLGPDARIIDVGGGASRLADALLERGFWNLTVLDIADGALAQARERLGARAAGVRWVAADITAWTPDARFDLWHDRAVFHFLTGKSDRAAYGAVLERALAPRGQAVIGTFAADGPERCSGLAVMRYDGDSLGRELGPAWRLAETVRHDHTTPAGAVQPFQFCRFARA